MLSKEDNEILTRVGPGTPMGNLLRRYWIPACLTSEVPDPDGPPVRVRLLGENLVAFRDTNGTVGLIEEECPHRGASLFFGRNEECGLRCTYHGWKFDVNGQCTDQRSELHPFAHRIKIASYPVHESGGIAWTYMGPPETMTPFRDFGTESLPAEQHQVMRETVYCNWVQSMDGDVDTAHISNLHQFDSIDDIPDDGTDRPGYPSGYMSMKFWRHDPRSLIEVDDTWHGFRYAGIRRTPNGHRHARITAWTFPAISIIAAIPFNTRQIYVVPVDDTTTNRYSYTTQPSSNPRGLGGPPFYTWEKYPFEQMRLGGTGTRTRRYTLENDYGIDRVAQKGTSFSGIPDFRAQDNMATETAGPIYDRTREHLGSTDVAVIRMHRILLRAAKGLAAGEAPPALTGDFRSIRSAEKILAEGEDWRVLGTNDDPIVQEALMALAGRRPAGEDAGEPAH